MGRILVALNLVVDNRDLRPTTLYKAQAQVAHLYFCIGKLNEHFEFLFNAASTASGINQGFLNV